MKRLLSIAPEWIVLFAGIVAAFHVGKLAPAIPVLQAEMGISLVEGGLLLSLVQFVGMSSGVFWGFAVGRIGLRRSVLMGLSLLTVVSLLGGFAQSAAQLLLLRALEGMGFVLVALSGPGLMRAIVPPERLNLSIGWWGTFMGLGAGSAMFLGPLFMEQLSWHGWWWSSALLTLGTLFVVIAVIDGSVDQQGAVAKTPLLASLSDNLSQVLRKEGPWLVAVMFAAYSGQWLAVIGFLPTIYTNAGISGFIVALLTALVALVNAGGNVMGGRLLHKGLSAERLLIIVFGLMGLMTWITYSTLFAEFIWLQILAVMLFSAVGGIIPAVLFAVAVQRAPRPDLVPTTIGWVQQMSALGQLSTPPLFAWVAVQVGGWSFTWWMTVSLSLLGVVLAVRLSSLSR
ncbi:CynX/NimT family MFS transporter [Marinobacterium sp. LSUCC0821]|uniref:MFS transporter n=1 Tax=Marinobacterium sp. LSUCC0821 TaxID=2668067 RepID=UPI0014524388|nr:MFS transporter [Marinobacterium sp. LSUCC0821]QJD71365.1 MFS transporter [Marinobacterium sp. LSUCC0821]